MASLPALQGLDPARSRNVLHDNEYYHSTGDSVIRIENTLFKVHKLFLTYNSAVFATLFDLPGETGRAEGLSDDLPIVLEGETAENFRIILKYVYARPSQTQITSVSITALAEMISLVQSAHKYEMDDWVHWGLQVLTRLLKDLNSLPAEHLQALHSLYNLLEDIPERTRMMTRWCEVVERENLPILPVLDAAERCGDEDAMAEAYCIQIRRWEKKATVIEPQSFSADGLSQDHVQRILSGYASLSLSWSQLHSREPSFPIPNAQFQCHANGPFVDPQAHEIACIAHSRTDGGPSNPNHMLGTFPVLFPYGQGGIEVQRNEDVPYEAHVRWALVGSIPLYTLLQHLEYADGRFRKDLYFIFKNSALTSIIYFRKWLIRLPPHLCTLKEVAASVGLHSASHSLVLD